MTDVGTDARTTRGAVLDVASEWLLYVSAALIVAGVLQPSIHKAGMFGFGGNEMSLLDVIAALQKSDQIPLAAIIGVFSIGFPLVKTLVAAILFRFGKATRGAFAGLLQSLGKWSMLDVFLAAVLIGFIQLEPVMDIEPRRGLYLFAAGVILNNLATMRLTLAKG